MNIFEQTCCDHGLSAQAIATLLGFHAQIVAGADFAALVRALPRVLLSLFRIVFVFVPSGCVLVCEFLKNDCHACTYLLVYNMCVRQARKESDCGSAQNGGDLGMFGRGMMQKPFEDVRRCFRTCHSFATLIVPLNARIHSLAFWERNFESMIQLCGGTCCYLSRGISRAETGHLCSRRRTDERRRRHGFGRSHHPAHCVIRYRIHQLVETRVYFACSRVISRSIVMNIPLAVVATKREEKLHGGAERCNSERERATRKHNTFYLPPKIHRTTGRRAVSQTRAALFTATAAAARP